MAKSNQITDSERDYYAKELAAVPDNTGNKVDNGRNFHSEGTNAGNNVDEFKDWLVTQGQTGVNLQDNWRAFLISEGYSGNVVDMTKQYYNDND